MLGRQLLHRERRDECVGARLNLLEELLVRHRRQRDEELAREALSDFDELVDDFRCDAVSWSTVVTGRLQRVARDQLEGGTAGFGLLRQFLQTMFFSNIAVAAM